MASPSPELCLQVDDTFRAHALSCRGGFDFTLLFEELILGVLPIGIVLLVVPFRLLYLVKSDHKVLPSKRPIYKTVSNSNRKRLAALDIQLD
jgi:ATP-binding cassette subfamily C (CFTR/MRP) protein 1